MIDLYGYKFSVYSWIAKFAFYEKGAQYNWIELNPFANEVDPNYLKLNPFCQVPTLVDEYFELYETGAITRYINARFDGRNLIPTDIRKRARVDQIISMVENYAYWPFVRQVFSHGVMGPRVGRPHDPNEVKVGLEVAERTLDALDCFVHQDYCLVGRELSLADLHLAPMLSYLCELQAGAAALQRRQKLNAWFVSVSERDGFQATKPELPPPVNGR